MWLDIVSEIHTDYEALNKCWKFVNIGLVPSYLDKNGDLLLVE